MNRVDLHIVVGCADCRQDWLDELQGDLAAQPANIFLSECVPGNVGAARAAGFAKGEAEFVSFADPDDRILPGAVQACIDALDADASLGAAFTGEQIVTALLDPAKPAAVRPYDKRLHLAKPEHVHGLIVMRRHLVEPWLADLPAYRVMPEWYLTLRIAETACLARVPRLGRLWRWHGRQATRTMAHLLGEERQRILTLFDGRLADKAPGASAAPAGLARCDDQALG